MADDTDLLPWPRRLVQLPVTAGLIAACVAAFAATLADCLGSSDAPAAVAKASLWSLGSCRDSLVRFGALDLGRLFVDGDWFRVASTGLLHGSAIHLTLNMWSLFAVGEWAENVWGRWRFAGLFAASSAAGCLASAAWAEAPMVVGASAGVFGIAGALLVGRLVGDGEVGEALSPISVRMLGGCLVALLLVGALVPVIAQAGHVGGLVMGACLGLAWSRGGKLQWVGWGGAAGAAAILAGLTLGPPRLGGGEAVVGYRLLELGRYDEAAEALDKALEGAPDDPVLANAVAYALAEAGVRLDRARGLVMQALAEEPDNADYLDTLGWIECRAGAPELGLAALRRARDAADEPIPEIEEHLRQCTHEGR